MTMHWAMEHLPRGWFHHGFAILQLVERHRPQVIVELGSYLGASGIAMARVASQWGGVVYCVDTWGGVPKSAKPVPPMRIFECATNLVRARVHPSMRLLIGRTDEVARTWNGPAIDFLYVDADHSEAGCRSDLDLWGAHVRSGGVIVGDDCDHPKYPGVRLAWEAYAAQIGMPLTFTLKADTNPPNMSLVYGVKP